MNLRIRLTAFSAVALALALAGCGGSSTGSSPEPAEHAAGHAGHAEGADAAATDSAAPDTVRPDPSGDSGYTLDAEVEQRGDGAYLLVRTNLKLSKENYGRSPVEGEGHIHLYINGNLIGPITDFEPVLLRNLKEGRNVVRVELAENNHSVIAGTSRTVEFDHKPPVEGPNAPQDTAN